MEVIVYIVISVIIIVELNLKKRFILGCKNMELFGGEQGFFTSLTDGLFFKKCENSIHKILNLLGPSPLNNVDF